jgi:DNA-binding CsgD family transcriptional regulator
MNVEAIDELLELIQMNPDHSTLFMLSSKTMHEACFQGFIHLFYDLDKNLIDKVSLGFEDRGASLISAVQTMLDQGDLLTGFTQFKSLSVEDFADAANFPENTFHQKQKWFYMSSFNNSPHDADVFVAVLENPLEVTAQRSVKLIAHLSRILNKSQSKNEFVARMGIKLATPQPDNSLLDKNLSEIDSKIMKYICLGLTNKEIADAMNYSLPSIRQRASSIYKVLGVKNRAQAVFELTRLDIDLAV